MRQVRDDLLLHDVLSICGVTHPNLHGERLLAFLRVDNVHVLSDLLAGSGRDLRRRDALQVHAHVLLDSDLQSYC